MFRGVVASPPAAADVFRRALKVKGLKLVMGTDAGAGAHGRNAQEIVYRVQRGGQPAMDAIVGATVRRFRPITLTAAAAILAMIPLTRQVFWGPMAVTIMGGLVIATVLTCLFLPALYAAWFRVKENDLQSYAPDAKGSIN